MDLRLTDDEVEALHRELDKLIEGDRYFLSPRIQTLRAIRVKLRPEPVREPSQPAPKPYAPPRATDDPPGAERRNKARPGQSMTLGKAASAGVRLIVWCKACQHQVEPDAGEMAKRCGAETPVPEWRERERLVCSKCGSREIDMVVSGTQGRTGPNRHTLGDMLLDGGLAPDSRHSGEQIDRLKSTPSSRPGSRR